MAFLIDSYNKYDSWDRAHSKYTFKVNEQWYAIKEVEMEWGLPKLPQPIDYTKNTKLYHIYNTLEEALQFVHQIKSMN